MEKNAESEQCSGTTINIRSSGPARTLDAQNRERTQGDTQKADSTSSAPTRRPRRVFKIRDEPAAEVAQPQGVAQSKATALKRRDACRQTRQSAQEGVRQQVRRRAGSELTFKTSLKPVVPGGCGVRPHALWLSRIGSLAASALLDQNWCRCRMKGVAIAAQAVYAVDRVPSRRSTASFCRLLCPLVFKVRLLA